MIPELRRAFNAAFRAESYAAMLRWLEEEAGFPVPFRVCETPLFLTRELTAELERAAHEVLAAVTAPDYLRSAERAVPPRYAVPRENAHTTFLQVDFALAAGAGGEVVPRLIELQGFPSLYGFQWLLERAYRAHFAIGAELSPYFGGLSAPAYVECLRQTIVGGHDPENVVLLEIEPEAQKTRVDFAATERLLGIKTVSTAAVVVRGDRAYYAGGGREVPIERIYNRVIFDEAARRGLDLGPLFRREVEVEWVGHPNWFWKISKFSLPFIHGRYCPPCYLLSDLARTEYPEDLENYVLKPLFSFAGMGVELGVTRERLRGIAQPENFILQRRVDYAPVVATPDEPAKAEVRMMFVWGKEGPPRLVNNLVRMTKGRMVGVDFNKDRTWIGASVALHPV
jgi:hypothetical protein